MFYDWKLECTYNKNLGKYHSNYMDGPFCVDDMNTGTSKGRDYLTCLWSLSLVGLLTLIQRGSPSFTRKCGHFCSNGDKTRAMQLLTHKYPIPSNIKESPKIHWWSISLFPFLENNDKPSCHAILNRSFHTLAKKSLYQCGPTTINGMRSIFYIEVPMCIFHLINDFVIKILIVASTPWIRAVNSTLSVKCVLFVLEQPHTIYQETNHLEIWEEFPTSSVGGKSQNM